MKSNDIDLKQKLTDARAAIQKAVLDGDASAFDEALDQIVQIKCDGVLVQARNEIRQLADDCSSQVLVARGDNVLTPEETTYYRQFIDAARSTDPKQALTGITAGMPRTILNRVFDDLTTNHPLLSALNFQAVPGLVDTIVNTNGYQTAAWGQLTDKIVKELSGGFKAISTSVLKLTAFLPVAKSMLDLGPSYIDRFVREVLYEAAANALEAGFVSGTGNGEPIGMIRQCGDNVVVTGGVYPAKDAVAIADLLPVTVGGLLADLATDSSGKTRNVTNVIMVVNPDDYYRRIMPATTLMAPDGSYRRDVLPYPIKIYPSPSMPKGQAVFGMGKRYFGLLGSDKHGKIDYSDHAQFLEDNRVYLIRLYANGMPIDNNDFILLDISAVEPILWTVVNAADASAGDV